MKKNLLPLLITCLAIASVRADLIWYEGFNYSDGNLPTVSGGVWVRTSGTLNDAFVKNKILEVAASSPGVLARTDDVYRRLAVAAGSPYTNGGVLYASFTVNCTNLPNAAGTYFASFYSTANGYFGRVHALTTGTALPNTWRLGVSGNANAASKVFPVDLATNVDYQVVVQWDPVTLYAITLWVNPLSDSDLSVVSSDALTPPATPVNSFIFRQAGSFGSAFFLITNLTTATTFGEAATNVWSSTPVAPTIVYQPKNATNFEGAAVQIAVVAAGQSLGNLTYQWVKDGEYIANPAGNSNVFSIASLSSADVGEYKVEVSNPSTSLSVTSQVAYVAVDPQQIPPFFVQSPKNTTNYFGQTATLTAAAAGPQPITYSWKYNNGLITSPNVSGQDTSTLTITDVQTNNGTVGTYTCVANNTYGDSTNANAYVAAIAPQAVSIAYLRTLVNSAYVPTNTTALWQATGIVTTFTNLTTGTTAGYYLQDSTAGINIFVTGQQWRPAYGDVVTFTGFLSTFRGTLELVADQSPGTSYTILSNNIPGLPVPKVISWTMTNNIPFAETNLEGSVVLLTNVYFGTNAGNLVPTSTSPNETAITVTNAQGKIFYLGFSAIDGNTAGQILPEFAYTVVGPLNQLTNVHADYQVIVTRFSDIVTNALKLANSHSGNSSTLTWEAAPDSYRYSIWGAATVNGPYLLMTNLLQFNDANGSYIDSSASGSQQFYRLSTP